jgi:hypothetical protein
MYMPAGYATLWQYCSSSRFNSPLLKNTFCFHTASAVLRSTEAKHIFMAGIWHMSVVVPNSDEGTDSI